MFMKSDHKSYKLLLKTMKPEHKSRKPAADIYKTRLES